MARRCVSASTAHIQTYQKNSFLLRQGLYISISQWVMMSRLTYSQRQRLPRSAFALKSQRKYPIEDINHARDALSRVSANGSAAQKRMVRAAVYRRYPE